MNLSSPKPSAQELQGAVKVLESLAQTDPELCNALAKVRQTSTELLAEQQASHPVEEAYQELRRKLSFMAANATVFSPPRVVQEFIDQYPQYIATTDESEELPYDGEILYIIPYGETTFCFGLTGHQRNDGSKMYRIREFLADSSWGRLYSCRTLNQLSAYERPPWVLQPSSNIVEGNLVVEKDDKKA